MHLMVPLGEQPRRKPVLRPSHTLQVVLRVGGAALQADAAATIAVDIYPEYRCHIAQREKAPRLAASLATGTTVFVSVHTRADSCGLNMLEQGDRSELSSTGKSYGLLRCCVC